MTTLALTSTESITIRESTAERFLVEAEYGPKSNPPPKHWHPDQDERFEVLEGEMIVIKDGQEQRLAAGEVIEIPRRSVHRMWNPGPGIARVSWETKPGGRTEEWFRVINSVHEGTLESRLPTPLVMGALLREYRDVFRLALAPEPVQRPLIELLAIPGRLVGYR